MDQYQATQEARKTLIGVASDLKKLRIDDPAVSRDRDAAVKACDDVARKIGSLPRDTKQDQLRKFVDAQVYMAESRVCAVAGSANMILLTYGGKNRPGLVERSPANFAHLKQIISWMKPIESRFSKMIDMLEKATGRLS